MRVELIIFTNLQFMRISVDNFCEFCYLHIVLSIMLKRDYLCNVSIPISPTASTLFISAVAAFAPLLVRCMTEFFHVAARQLTYFCRPLHI